MARRSVAEGAGGARRTNRTPIVRRAMRLGVALAVVAGLLLVLSACTVSCIPSTGAGYPAKTCPTATFPPTKLTGAPQHVHTTITGVYVKGTATYAWTLSTYMVPTRTNPNVACRTVAAFCDSTAKTAANANARIQPATLALKSPKCTPYGGNTNPPPTPLAGGTYSYTTLIVCKTASKTHSAGTFEMTATLTLTVPASSLSGKYLATVLFLVT